MWHCMTISKMVGKEKLCTKSPLMSPVQKCTGRGWKVVMLKRGKVLLHASYYRLQKIFVMLCLPLSIQRRIFTISTYFTQFFPGLVANSCKYLDIKHMRMLCMCNVRVRAAHPKLHGRNTAFRNCSHVFFRNIKLTMPLPRCIGCTVFKSKKPVYNTKNRPKPGFSGFSWQKTPEKPGKTGFPANTKIRLRQKALSPPPLMAPPDPDNTCIPSTSIHENAERKKKCMRTATVTHAAPGGERSSTASRPNSCRQGAIQ